MCKDMACHMELTFQRLINITTDNLKNMSQ